ncbi:hypothetical protein TI03_00320 [Achromatium sp. WMS1]|nr:hypothetical protein TI03_00320 [Achromatium sp. WMS1]
MKIPNAAITLNLLLLVLIWSIADVTHAADVQQISVPPGVPWLVISPSSKAEQPMQLKSMDIQGRIVGLQAKVTTELTFFNPNHRLLEGKLQFPLPDGAVITGYALDVNGEMVDGVIVNKEKARVVFETEVRKNVDPGIVEHVAGNLYRTRIYPLPARGTRRISFTYVTTLPVDQQGDAAWHYPMPIGQIISDVNVRVEVMRGLVQPKIGGFGDLKFQSLSNLWVAETKLNDVKPTEDIWIALPQIPAQITNVERTPDGTVYFAISDRYIGTTQITKKPQQLGIMWDASGSRNSRNGEHLAQEIAALTNLGVELHVIIFRDQPEAIRRLPNPNTLKDIAYDGGTDLLKVAQVVRESDIEQWLLFSDGFDTLNSTLPDFGTKQVTAVVNQTTAHRELLRQVCSHIIDLQQLEADAILQPVTRLIKVHGAGVNAIQGLGTNATGRVNVYGKLDATATELQLEYSDGHKSSPIKLPEATAGTLLANMWAAQRINKLAVQADINADELLALGRQFGIVSPATSLIVLENLQQYIQHDIEPPASLPRMREQWHEHKATKAKQKQQQRTSKLEQVLTMWQKRVAWWQNSRPQTLATKSQRQEDVDTGTGTVMYNAIAPTASPPPSPATLNHRNEREESARSQRRSVETTSRRFAAESRIRARDMHLAPQPPEATAGSGHGYFSSPQSSLHAGDVTNGLASSVASSEHSTSRASHTLGTATIKIKAWDPSTPYLTAIKSAPKADRYQVYLQQRTKFATSPAFFLDCAEYFFKTDDTAIGIRILTNLAELKLEEASLLRVLAWRLQQVGELKRATTILRKVQKLRPEEPQSHRDLALVLAEHGQMTEAMELLLKVIMGDWQRFAEIELIALEELNAIMALNQLPPPKDLDPRLIKNLDVDVRIVMVWDADNTDVDLHVVEPTGEEAYYSHNRTSMGGLVSRDFTRGYGPEEYMVRRAQSGTFHIFAHYYGSNQQTVIGPTTITATVFTNFGRSTQKRQILTLRLDKVKSRADIGFVRFSNHQPVQKLN